jgi:hypothetical protein
VIHDRDDREVPYAGGVATANAWPGARLFTAGGLGHRRLLSDPEVSPPPPTSPPATARARAPSSTRRRAASASLANPQLRLAG